MEKKKKIGYFKRFKMAIFELENYVEFLAEKFGKSLGFCIKTVTILSLILVVTNILNIYSRFGTATKYVDYIIPNFEYVDNKMNIETEDVNNSERKMVVSTLKGLDLTYREIFQGKSYNKSDLLDYVQKNERSIIIAAIVAMWIEGFLEMLFFWLLMGLLTSFVGWVVFKLSRIRMKFSKLYMLSIYSSTLTVVLTVVYSILNTCLGIYIEVFDYLSMLISYIYITAVIYMIRSDLIKEQYELIRIVTEQKKNEEKVEENPKEEEPKSEKENDENKKDGDQSDKEKESKSPIDDEPDGSEI